VLTLPIAATMHIEVRNTHLNYALTWFGIALSLIGVYFAYHINAGRFGFRKSR
jgi:surfeit locus 1 family protein